MENVLKWKRQIEILGLVIMNRKEVLRLEDLSDFFQVSIPTLNRDLLDLRNSGVKIHSTKKEGIKLFSKVEPEILQNLLMEYLTYNYSNHAIDWLSVFSQVEPLEQTLEVIVKIEQAIKQGKKITIITNEENSLSLKELYYEPRLIYRESYELFLLYSNNSCYESINIRNISFIKISSISYQRVDKEILLQEINKKKNKRLTPQKHFVKLAFTNFHKCTFPDEIMKINIYKEDKGITTIEAQVTSLDSLITWIILNNENILFVEPDDLMNKIFDKARELLEIEKRRSSFIEMQAMEERESPGNFKCSRRISKIESIELDDTSYFNEDSKGITPKTFSRPLIIYKKLKYKELNIALNLNIGGN